MIYLLFGEMGVGKNYVGERLAKYLNCPFFDGDTVITADMMRDILGFKILSPQEIDRYVYEYLIPAIIGQALQPNDLVAAQALYQQHHRDDVIEALSDNALLKATGHNLVKPVWIVSPSFISHGHRLFGRDQGAGWLAYWLACRPLFQEPPKETAMILNETDSDLLGQIRRITGEW